MIFDIYCKLPGGMGRGGLHLQSSAQRHQDKMSLPPSPLIPPARSTPRSIGSSGQRMRSASTQPTQGPGYPGQAKDH